MLKKYNFQELEDATGEWSHLTGRGQRSEVYKGYLDEQWVAVKKLNVEKLGKVGGGGGMLGRENLFVSNFGQGNSYSIGRQLCPGYPGYCCNESNGKRIKIRMLGRPF